MKSMRSLFALAFVVIAVTTAPAQAARLVPVDDQTNAVPNIGSKPLTLQEVRKDILKGALGRGWKMVSDNSGTARFRIDDQRKGAFNAVIDIVYTPTNYTIKYVSSDGLKYNDTDRTIHSRYANWMNLLVQSINRELIASAS